jgi:ribonuclease Z
MNAEKILLTHFSARYPKMPPQIVEQDGSPTTTTSPLTAHFRSLSPTSSPTSPISALPDTHTDSTTPPRSPIATGSGPGPGHRERKQKQPIIGLAFDHMNITLGEFWKLRTYLPAMDQAFGKDEKDEDEESEGRAMDKMVD